MASAFPPTYVPGFHDAVAVAAMPYSLLGTTDLRLSKLGIGGSAAASVFGPTDDTESEEVIVASVRAGVNVIDTSPWYGHGKSELLIGRALKRIPREAVYVHSKVGRYASDVRAMFDFSAERTTASVDESLARLGIEYLDCMQVHDPEFALDWREIVEHTLPALEQCRLAGKIRRIGMTGYNLQLHRLIVEAAAAAGITVHLCLTYCHYALNDTSLADSGFTEWCAAGGRGLMNASPLAMGLLTGAAPPPWHPASAAQKAAAAQAGVLAAARGLSLPDVATRFSLSAPGVACTLFSTDKMGYLESALRCATQAATPEEEQLVADLRNGPLSQAGQGGTIGWAGREVEKYWAKLGRAATADGVYRRVLVQRDGLYECKGTADACSDSDASVSTGEGSGAGAGAGAGASAGTAASTE